MRIFKGAIHKIISALDVVDVACTYTKTNWRRSYISPFTLPSPRSSAALYQHLLNSLRCSEHDTFTEQTTDITACQVTK